MSRELRGRTLVLLALALFVGGGLLWTQAMSVGVLLDLECRHAPQAGVCPWLPRAIVLGVALQVVALVIGIAGIRRYLREPVGT